ncbi:MAG: L,D-transpeptidase family protein [Agriterribacter sp.]
MMVLRFLKSSICICVPVLFFACSEPEKPKTVEIVKKPEEVNKKTNENIHAILNYAADNKNKLNDTISLNNFAFVNAWYKDRDSLRTWSNEKHWNRMADSLFYFIKNSEHYGLFPADYHYTYLNTIHHSLKTDSAAMLDAALWARADVLLTDAFIQIVKDLKIGRLDRDSITLRKDTTFNDSLCTALLHKVYKENQLTPLLEQLEPAYEGYREIRTALGKFLDSMNRKEYTYISYPFEDSAQFISQLQTRLYEGGYIDFNNKPIDTATLAAAVRKFQEEKKLKVDGKAGISVVTMLNNTDVEKFKRIAINLDRYKLMPDSMPVRYAFVNLPAFQLRVWDTDTLRVESKVIVGNPKTRTPLLTSELTNFVLFPQWTVPQSIIFKEMLPKIQKKVEYLDKENLMVVDKNDSIVDPHTVNWFRLNKNNFPYQLKQREGDDNSLGVIKFNFRNKYSVYLHDTNARGLFARKDRALSHGCVRVQEWQKLSKYLVKNDSLRYKPDTLSAWMKRKEKHMISFSRRVPIFIRYITCEAKEGNIIFYDDIYAEDKMVREKYLYNRKVLYTL